MQQKDPQGGPPGFRRRGTRHSKQGRVPRPDALDDEIESQGEPQWTQRIPLLHAAAAVDDVLTQMEERVTGVAGLHPCGKAWEVAPKLHEHGLAANAL